MNNISEYSIINTKEIEKKIKELQSYVDLTNKEIEKHENSLEIAYRDEEWDNKYYQLKDNKNCQIGALVAIQRFKEEILNNSIPLENTLKEAYKAGNEAEDVMYKGEFTGKLSPSFEDYIKNLTIKK